MDNSKYLTIEEAMEILSLKKIDILDIIRDYKLAYRTDEPHYDRMRAKNIWRIITNVNGEKTVESHEPKYLNKKDFFDFVQAHPEVKMGCGSNKDITLPFLNEKHPYYAPELAMAIKAWLYLYHQGNLKKRREDKLQIKDYLIKTFTKKGKPPGENLKERIAQVAVRGTRKPGGHNSYDDF